MTAQMYRKKPVVIEAFHLTADNQDEALTWVRDTAQVREHGVYAAVKGSIILPTLEGDMEARVGDFIIKGVQGEVYPCKPDIFEATYEPHPTELREHAARWDGESRPYRCETCGSRVVSRLESWVHVSTDPVQGDAKLLQNPGVVDAAQDHTNGSAT